MTATAIAVVVVVVVSVVAVDVLVPRETSIEYNRTVKQ